MTTFYLDYENGNDASAGTSFATRWKTLTNGATAARIAPGDEIRIMASTDVTSLGQTATWTGERQQATRAIVSSTNTTPIVVTLSGANYASLNPSVGDTVIISGHTINTKANGVWKLSAVNGSTTVTLVNADGSNSVGNGAGGASGTIRKATNMVVTLSSDVTKNIAVNGNQGAKGNWTASANATASVITSDFKEGGECQQLSIAAGFTTGLAAYYATGTLNLSTYQQVSFFIKQTVGAIGAANSVSLALCTDTAGATVAHTVNVPLLGALNQWSPITVNLGANLNSAIQSIAFYVNTDNGAQTFLIDNVIACKASSSPDSLNLTSLIGKNTGDEAWFAIQSINGTRVMLEGISNTIPGSAPQRGYSGTTESATTYKRETIKTAMAATSFTAVQTIQDSGTLGNQITFSGGWNRTDMSTQTGETWFDGQNGFGLGISAGSGIYTKFDKINFTRYNQGLYDGSGLGKIEIGGMYACSNSAVPINIATGALNVASKLIAVCNGAGIQLGPNSIVQTIKSDSNLNGGLLLGASCIVNTIASVSNNTSVGITGAVNSYVGIVSAAHGNSTSGYQPANGSIVGSLTSNNNPKYAIDGGAAYDWQVNGGSSTGNSTSGANITTGKGYLRNFTINEATEVTGYTAYSDARIYSQNHDNTADNATVFCEGGLITQQSSIIHGTAPTARKFAVTSANRSSTYPLNLVIATVGFNASALVTVSVWFRRDNTGLTGRLICKGGQIAGVSSDVTSDMTVAANTWEQLTITFTPSVKGAVEIEAQFWGGTTFNGYVSTADMVITQA